MTRDELVQAIIESGGPWSCPDWKICEKMPGCNECAEKQLAYYEKHIKENTLKEFIKRAEKEIDDIYNWDDDDYENGLRDGYQYSILIAEQLKVIL